MRPGILRDLSQLHTDLVFLVFYIGCPELEKRDTFSLKQRLLHATRLDTRLPCQRYDRSYEHVAQIAC